MKDHAVDVDYESSVWTKELLEGCLNPELKKQVKDEYDRLDCIKRAESPTSRSWLILSSR